MGSSCHCQKDSTASNAVSNRNRPEQQNEKKSLLIYDDSKIDEIEDVKLDITTLESSIEIECIQARNLPKSHSGDYYVRIILHDDENIKKRTKYTTDKISKNINPIWDKQFIHNEKGLFRKLNGITFEIWDCDNISKDDFVASYTIETLDGYMNGTPLPQWLPLVNKQNKRCGELQVQINCILDREETDFNEYTHVLEITVKNGENMKKGDLYARLDWGTQYFTTKVSKNTTVPEWNEKTFLFVDKIRHKDYVLKCRVIDDDKLTSDDNVGNGYINLDKMKENENNTVILYPKKYNKDKQISKIESSIGNSDLKKSAGQINIATKLYTRKVIEDLVINKVLKYYDKNNDGKLDKKEVDTLLGVLGIVSDDTSKFFTKYDKNYNGKIDKIEIINLLKDYKTQRTEMVVRLINLAMNNNLDYINPKVTLMDGFTRKNKKIKNRKVIKLKDRKTGLLVQEHIPNYIFLSLKLIYDHKTTRALSNTKLSAKILRTLSVNQGREYDNPKSTSEIKEFIKLHNINTDEIDIDNIKSFKTFNDFFARDIKYLKFRPMDNNPKVIISPADCRCMVFNSIRDSKIWIKGKNWTIEKLLKHKTNLIEDFKGCSFVNSRLAPQDYHKWHYPCDGIIKSITPIKGKLVTVNPIAINEKIDVYTQNKRCIIEIQTKKFGKVIMIPISATLVGSYNLFSGKAKKLKISQVKNKALNISVKKGEIAGEFRFGGSTVLTLFEANKVKFDSDLIQNSNERFETLIKCRDRIGIVL